jgi:short-subunit dehydrogenase
MKKKYFKNKTAVITGAASGIGREFAIELAKLGSNLVISDINLDRLNQVKEEIEQLGIKVVAVKCDVTKQMEVKKMAKAAITELGDIHFLFSNAGIATGGQFEYFTVSHWKRIININLWGMIHCVTAFIPKMIEQNYGHIITTASIAGSFGIGGLIPYCTTKFANAGFCEALYGEYKGRGINVSIICPFPIKTNLIETVGISIPPKLLEGIDPGSMQKGIEEGKIHYWTKFCEKKGFRTGFCGGFELERAVKRFMNKISKKKLYIYDRRYGRFLQFLRGLWPGMYKSTVKAFGNRHTNLLDETYDISLKVAKEDMNKR